MATKIIDKEAARWDRAAKKMRARIAATKKTAKKTTKKKRTERKPLRWWLTFYRDNTWLLFVQNAEPRRDSAGEWMENDDTIWVNCTCQRAIPKRYRDKAERTGKAVLMTTLSE